MFIRAKKIKGNEYAYAVKNRWTKKGPRQKVRSYLGPVVPFEEVRNLTFEDISGNDNSAIGLITRRIALELMNHGFTRKKEIFRYEDISVSLVSGIVKKGDQKVVLKFNEDYFCTYTLRRLLKFKSDKDHQGVATDLAKAFVQAGVPIEQELFIEIFDKIYRPGQSFVGRRRRVMVCVTGTPGTGKTTLSKHLADLLAFRYVNVNKLITKYSLSERYDKKSDSHIIDTRKLSEVVEKLYVNARTSLIIDSHLSHHIKKKLIDLVVVTRTELPVLKTRLEARGYSEKKVKENLEAETFEVCKSDALEAGLEVQEYWSDKKDDIQVLITRIGEICSSRAV